MKQKYTRILQRHGTSSEIHFPPEACKKLNATKGDQIEFELSPYDNKVTLRKAGASDKEQPKPLSIMLGNNICIIFGKPGSGKTELEKILYQNHSRLIIYDNTGEHNRGVTIKNLKDIKTFLDKVHHGNFRITYQPTHPKNEFDSICKLVNKYTGPMLWTLTFVIENLDLYCEPNISPEFSKLIENGFDNELQLIGTTQRPDQIDKRLTRQIKQIFELKILAERLILNALNNDDYH